MLYPLTAKHKVVFAGNPVSYGDERALQPFFEDHGNALVFEPMPPALIYDRMLKPLFVGTALEPLALSISKEILLSKSSEFSA